MLRDVSFAAEPGQVIALLGATGSVGRNTVDLIRRDPDRFDAWAARITCRCCYRLAKHERRFSLPSPAEPRPDTTAFTAEVADQDEMERAFRCLSPDHRAVLVLHYYLGLTLGEVAETLDISPGTVGSRLHYAVRSLRAALESEARTAQVPERST